ncbi:MAG: glycerol kinase GlpK [Victivallaceae bacterium]|nr:glycerol kinase GlpK [Victivallaceae bacterium]
MKYILALDQGTTSSRALLVNHAGQICGVRQQEFPQIFPRTGWVEHDPTDILNSQLTVTRDLINKICNPDDEIIGLGITNQRETVIVWNKHTGNPVYNAIVWQCQRSAEYCNFLRDNDYTETIHRKTGLVVDAYFSGPKIKWILDNIKGARQAAEQGDLLFGTVDSWLIWNLTGGKYHITDYSNASRTMLFNINTLTWDEELLELMKIPAAMLPEVHSSSMIYGHTEQAILGRSIPISAILGDQQAALFGNLCLEPGTVKNTYGTGAFLLMNTGNRPFFSQDGLLTTIAWQINKETIYALEGTIFMAGATIQWLRDNLGLIKDAAESETLAASVEDSAGVYFVPAFQGLGTPYWNMETTALISGLTRGAQRAHIVRAALEAIAYRTNDVLSVMQHDTEMDLNDMLVDGGAAMNNFLLQFQADISNLSIIRPQNIESTAMGIAFAAGLAVGFWENSDELRTIKQQTRVFTPQMTANKRNTLYQGWQNAVKRCL